jgi:hypothetical protein
MKRPRKTIYQHPTLDKVWVTRDGAVFVAAPVEMSRGYQIASIRKRTRREKQSVHSLILETFAGLRPRGAVARHLNGTREDNRAINLAWGTQKDNALDSVLHGAIKVGEQNPSSRLTLAEVTEIINRFNGGEAATPLAREFGVKISTVRDIFKKRTWMSADPAYKVWASMIQRCTNPNVKCWRHYGGRGIQVSERWRLSFTDFLADVGPRPSMRHSLDRIDVNGHYEPANVRWATRSEQRRNQRLPTTEK